MKNPLEDLIQNSNQCWFPFGLNYILRVEMNWFPIMFYHFPAILSIFY